MKKLLNYVLGFTSAAVLLTAGAFGAQAATVSYGNYSENILNGGVLAEDASGHLYYANTDKADFLYRDDQLIANDPVENINVIGDTVYYTTKKSSGSAVMSVGRSGGMKKELLSTSQTIEEMYVDSQGTIYYLVGGQVFERQADADKSTIIAQGSITHFIPTTHGVIVAKGKRGAYTLCADGRTIQNDVESFYTYEDYLLFTRDGSDYQVRIHDLFDGFTASAIQKYDLGDSTAAVKAFAENLEEDGECEECAANAKNGTATLAEDKDSVSAVKATGITSALHSGMVSEGQYNIVLRARQQHEIEWTPKANIKGWGNAYTFNAGTTYSGLPYGQPATKGYYVPWQASLVDFITAVNDPSSDMYTKRATYNRSAPYYSCDCSSFVSWSWDLASRQYTGSIAYFATEVTTKSIYSLQVGDAFNKSGSHVVLVSDIGYRGDEIVYIDIMEQTPPSTRYTRWGEGGTKKLSDFYDKYWGKGYKLIRCKTRDAAVYTPSAAVQLDGEVAPSLANSGVTLSATTVNLNTDTNATQVLSYTSTVSGNVTWESSNSKVASVGTTGKITAKKAGSAVISMYVGGNLSAKATVYVYPEKTKITSAKSSAAGTVKIKWEEVPSAVTVNYEVLRKKADGTWESVGSATSTSFTDKGLASYTDYTYTIRAVATLKNGTLLKGDYDTVGKTARTMIDTPVFTEVTPATATSMKMSWNAVKGAATYKVYRKKSGKWKNIGITSKTTYKEKKLTAGKKYTYTLVAVGADGKTKSSYVKKGVTTKMTVPTPELKDLKITGLGKTTLTWKKVKGATGYQVWRKIGKKKYKMIATVKGTKYSDSGLKPGKKYTYTVRAVSKANGKTIASGYDKEGLSVTMKLGAPELVSAVSEGTGSVKVSWEAVEGAEYYSIYRMKSGGKWGTLVGTVKGKKLSFTDTKLAAGSTQTYTVRAAWKKGKKYYRGFYDTKGVTAVVR